MTHLEIASVKAAKPDIARIVDRVRYYSNGKSAFGVLEHGTCFFPEVGKRFDEQADRILDEVKAKPLDFTVKEMDDHNFIVSFGEHIFGVVLKDEFEMARSQIEREAVNAMVDERLVGVPGAPADHLLIGLLARTRLLQDLNERRLIQTVQAESR